MGSIAHDDVDFARLGVARGHVAQWEDGARAVSTTKQPPHERVREDVIDAAGTVTLRVSGRLHHIGIGRTHARTRVLILVPDLHGTRTHDPWVRVSGMS